MRVTVKRNMWVFACKTGNLCNKLNENRQSLVEYNIHVSHTRNSIEELCAKQRRGYYTQESCHTFVLKRHLLGSDFTANTKVA